VGKGVTASQDRGPLYSEPEEREVELWADRAPRACGSRSWLPYLDLFGVEGHNETQEQHGGKADQALNQEQVEDPLREKDSEDSAFQLPVPSPFFQNPHPFSICTSKPSGSQLDSPVPKLCVHPSSHLFLLDLSEERS
jgi:hypothetical protein